VGFRDRIVVSAVLIASACTSFGPTASPPTLGAREPTPSDTPVVTAVVSPPASDAAATGLIFHNSAPQARMVATLVTFIDAYNAGRVEDALSFLADDVVTSDCDFRSSRVTTADGIAAARQWLRERAADHDQLVLQSIANQNPDPSSGSHVVAVAYVRRTSDTLRALGFINGITPNGVTKVVFTPSDDRIRAFANGPLGGGSDLCRPGS
jgi:hypothetical protein